jgi:hypothetical protein
MNFISCFYHFLWEGGWMEEEERMTNGTRLETPEQNGRSRTNLAE